MPSGSFGKVYKAWDEKDKIYVALKVSFYKYTCDRFFAFFFLRYCFVLSIRWRSRISVRLRLDENKGNMLTTTTTTTSHPNLRYRTHMVIFIPLHLVWSMLIVRGVHSWRFKIYIVRLVVVSCRFTRTVMDLLFFPARWSKASGLLRCRQGWRLKSWRCWEIEIRTESTTAVSVQQSAALIFLVRIG